MAAGACCWASQFCNQRLNSSKAGGAGCHSLATVDVLRALTVLLELGLLQPEYPDMYEMLKLVGTPPMNQPGPLPVTYELTEIGRAVIMEIALQHGGASVIGDSDLRTKLDKYFSETQTKLGIRREIAQRFTSHPLTPPPFGAA